MYCKNIRYLLSAGHACLLGSRYLSWLRGDAFLCDDNGAILPTLYVVIHVWLECTYKFSF